MGEGFTPLVEAPGLAKAVGVGRLLIKNETTNPTWSFKDRGTVVAVADALCRGGRALGVVSTGNMAASVAAYGARARVPVLVLVSAETPAEKLPPVAVYGCTIVRVSGDYGALYYRSLELEGIRFVNSDAPTRVEGSKTIAFEICEQSRFVPPDWVIVPTSSGGNLRGILKGFEEMHEANLIPSVPRMVCAQASGCAPIATAWRRGDDTVTPVVEPRTVAHAIANPFPPSGNAVLRKLRKTAGTCVTVSDQTILDAQLEMASAGVFGQPVAAASLAAARVLAGSGVIGRDDTVVCVATGGGLKVTGTTAGRTPSYLDCALGDLASTASTWLRRTSATGVSL
jgi:threonine synthase